jgi:amino acid transporter
MDISFKRLLIGRAVANRNADTTKLGVFSGLPAMGLDGFSSAAYGPEAALTVLVAAGTAGLAAIGPVTWAILLLLAILGASYWQTIGAYPNNGGSYIVAKDNLGDTAGLIAAAALMVDYTLNVAVGISAGVAALTSTVPALQHATLALCLAVLVVLTVMNLRGTRQSGLVWSLPTYLFVLGLGVVMIWGLYVGHAASGDPAAVTPLPELPSAIQPLSWWLLLRAFAAGCTAMTGVEAVSNGVGAFEEPSVQRARVTLMTIVVVLGLLLLGVAHLVPVYGVSAMDQSKPGYRTVLSQLVGAINGQGVFYDVVMASILAVLCLSANTSFVGFPRMCHLVARDGFLPQAFVLPGRRLVYSVGIIVLCCGAGALLVAFGGITDRLIPLFAIGAFLSFTLSQAGMAMHWWRQRHTVGGATHRTKLIINGGGAIATGAALGIILVAKFAEGAWITVIIIPCLVVLLRSVRNHYDWVDARLKPSIHALDLDGCAAPVALVPIKRWDRLAHKAIGFACCMAHDVTAVHVTTLEGDAASQEAAELQRRWHRCVERPARAAGLHLPRLVVVESEYRSLLAPVLKGIEDTNAHYPNRPIIVVLPQLVEARWWEHLLHVHREWRLRGQLLRYGGDSVSVVSVPGQLRRMTPSEGIAEEEDAPTTA